MSFASYRAKNPVASYNWSKSKCNLNLLPLETINLGLVLPEYLLRDITLERSPSTTSTESNPFSISKCSNLNSIILCCGASIIQIQFRLSPYFFGQLGEVNSPVKPIICPPHCAIWKKKKKKF